MSAHTGYFHLSVPLSVWFLNAENWVRKRFFYPCDVVTNFSQSWEKFYSLNICCPHIVQMSENVNDLKNGILLLCLFFHRDDDDEFSLPQKTEIVKICCYLIKTIFSLSLSLSLFDWLEAKTTHNETFCNRTRRIGWRSLGSGKCRILVMKKTNSYNWEVQIHTKNDRMIGNYSNTV